MRVWPMKYEQEWCVQLFSKSFKSYRIFFLLLRTQQHPREELLTESAAGEEEHV